MSYLLFVIYLIFFCWLLVKVPFVKASKLDAKTLLILFLLKIVAGIAIGWFSLHVYGRGNDYWDNNAWGWDEYQLLLHAPKEYFTNIFSTGYTNGYGGMLNSGSSYWNDLANNIVIKAVSVFNIFSGGNYYVNSIFFNFLVFFGHIALYRVFTAIYTRQNKIAIVGCFLLPSVLYFSSGIHKDGFVFLLLGLVMYFIYTALKQKKFTVLRLTAIFACLVLILFIRSFVCIVLIPALIAWILSARLQWKPYKTFAVVYLVTALLFFGFNVLVPSIDPLQIVVNKQTAYLALPKAATEITIAHLQPTVKSFIGNMPQALGHTLLRPYITELPVKTLLPFNIELLFYQLALLLFLFFPQKKLTEPVDPFIVFAIFFTISSFIIIGYIASNLGTLLRYRSIYFAFIVTPLLYSINWEKLRKNINIKK